jgi:hypothetical protein
MTKTQELAEKAGDEAFKMLMQAHQQLHEGILEALGKGQDFTFKIEVRGNKGKIIHVRKYSDEISKPGQMSK